MKSALGFFKCSRMLKKKKRGQSLTKFEPVVWTKSTLVWFNSDDFFFDKYEGGGAKGESSNHSLYRARGGAHDGHVTKDS